jgi:hypothetical protein
LIIAAALIVAIVVLWASMQIASELKALRGEASRTRAVALMQMLASGVAASAHDPRALLVWQPLATAARQMCPAEFAALDRAAGATFPFTKEQLQAAHAEWTAEWLAWERAHDGEYKLKVAEVEHELGELSTASASPFVRARFDAIEREKLDRYQRRYQEYVRVSKALKALDS